MDELDISNFTDTSISQVYWVASRNVFSDSDLTRFGVSCMINSSSFAAYNLCNTGSMGNVRIFSQESGFRPVIRLKSGVKVSNPSAAGTSTDPYELEI